MKKLAVQFLVLLFVYSGVIYAFMYINENYPNWTKIAGMLCSWILLGATWSFEEDVKNYFYLKKQQKGVKK